MKFDEIEGRNPLDKMTVVGKGLSRIDGPLKVTGATTYAHLLEGVGDERRPRCRFKHWPTPTYSI